MQSFRYDGSIISYCLEAYETCTLIDSVVKNKQNRNIYLDVNNSFEIGWISMYSSSL